MWLKRSPSLMDPSPCNANEESTDASAAVEHPAARARQYPAPGRQRARLDIVLVLHSFKVRGLGHAPVVAVAQLVLVAGDHQFHVGRPFRVFSGPRALDLRLLRNFLPGLARGRAGSRAPALKPCLWARSAVIISCIAITANKFHAP